MNNICTPYLVNFQDLLKMIRYFRQNIKLKNFNNEAVLS